MIATYETDLLCRRPDANGDYMLGAGDVGFATGQEAMRLVLDTRIRSCAGEWWEGDDDAIPWMTEIIGALIPENRLEEIDLLIVARIQDTVGVLDVSNVESSLVNRKYQFSCTVATVYGDVPLEVSI